MSQSTVLAERQPSSAKLLSAESLADLLAVSVRTVWRLRSAGRLPKPIKLGGSIRWRAAEIETWISKGCPRLSEWETRQ